MIKKIKNLRGFTLIELLVVIAIIGLLSTMAVYAYNLARVEARDAKRKSDLKQIQKALELYYDDFGTYPTEAACDSSVGSCSSCPCTGSDWDYANASYIGRSLRDNDILKDLPIDPINDITYHYRYEPDCNQGRCPSPLGCCYYDLRARLEKTGAWHILTGGRY
jgi:prepilin-type N-terminal cleavage/methylation domain-containing protein